MPVYKRKPVQRSAIQAIELTEWEHPILGTQTAQIGDYIVTIEDGSQIMEPQAVFEAFWEEVV